MEPVRRQAVQAFCSGVQCGLGTSGAVAVGPLGRQADAGVQVGTAGSALLLSYSVSRGAFAGAPPAPVHPVQAVWLAGLGSQAGWQSTGAILR